MAYNPQSFSESCVLRALVVISQLEGAQRGVVEGRVMVDGFWNVMGVGM